MEQTDKLSQLQNWVEEQIVQRQVAQDTPSVPPVVMNRVTAKHKTLKTIKDKITSLKSTYQDAEAQWAGLLDWFDAVQTLQAPVKGEEKPNPHREMFDIVFDKVVEIEKHT